MIVLEPLPYDQKALEPFISEETLSFHYGKHHAGYVTKLNGLLENSTLKSDQLEDLLTAQVAAEHKGIYNNAAQIWNHSFYWKSMRPASNSGAPPPELLKVLQDTFGSLEQFQSRFAQIALSHFGSGWVWLVKNKSTGQLKIVDTHDAYNPLTQGDDIPLLVLDVWEHAYYIDKRNNRGSYVEDWLKLVNWDFAWKNYTATSKL